MAGGGGGGPFVNRTPEDLVKMVKKTEDDTAIRSFETDLSGLLNELLGEANSRDVAKVQDRLDVIKSALEGSLEGAVDSLFGGSVAKHTYVDGLSDVDSLLILDDADFSGHLPSEAIASVAKILREELGGGVKVSSGRLAVTVAYPDGLEIQLLPAFQTEAGLKVPSFRHDGWSGISPEKFQSALTTRNAECGGKLVPTIKLAKAVMGTLPDGQRLTGYHVESLAIAAFRDYAGPKTTASMLPIFFERAAELVAHPIRDSTGQSVHVDGYLGDAGSLQRVAASHVLSRIAKRMRNASAHRSKEQWEAMLKPDGT